MIRYLCYLTFSVLCYTLLVLAILAGFLYYQVIVDPGTEIDEANINAILARESPVFYRDGTTRLGVLFEEVHRQYVKFEDIPQNFVNALLAAEDSEFYEHYGVNPKGIARAMLVNIEKGKIVQGGSTITQQAAKNLFKRESRNLKEKLRELLFALRLEHHYSKNKIFEFYSNQFFVSGTGHGLGVAARYYFDKAPQDLSLLECVFIAASVKQPNHYNPFLRQNQANPETVQKRINERMRYVLNRMVKLGTLSYQERMQLHPGDLVFNQGKMGYAQSTAMDLVKEGVNAPFLADILEENGISNISTSGARIITSLDPAIQAKSTYALRRHLSQLDVRLRGYNRTQTQEEYAQLNYDGDTEYIQGAFVFGTVEQIRNTGGKPEIQVVLNEQAKALLDNKGIGHMAEALAKHRKGTWAKAAAEDSRLLLRALQPGDRIYASIREIDANGRILLDLERYPKVEGAAFVLQQGAIRGMVGGMSNLHYNRATMARRLMGSTFKVFIYAAAMQLGWSPVDLLSNQRDAFIYMNRPYFPRPDHSSPHSRVTMSWAGVTSENLATVWLLYHLLDHLDPPAIREMAAQLDLAPRNQKGISESYESYATRIRDQFGLRINSEMLEEAAYDSAVRALKSDFLFENRQQEYSKLANLKYGLNADRLSKPRVGDSSRDQRRDTALLYPNYLSLRRQLRNFQQYQDSLSGTYFVVGSSSEAEGSTPAVGQMAHNGEGLYIYTTRSTLSDAWIPLDRYELLSHISSLSSDQFDRFWNQVLIGGMFTAGTLNKVEEQMKIERKKFKVAHPYTMEVLTELRDFRLLLSLHYMVRLAQECGINSRFDPVLSMPLGSNVVTLADITRLYETMVTGSYHGFVDAADLASLREEGQTDLDGPAIIERIETPEGRVVYNRSIHKTRVFDPATAASLANILQNAVTYGTGRYARDNVSLRSEDPERMATFSKLKIRGYPLLGKTGTANSYRNTAFLGFVPNLAPDNATISLDNGYAVGVYAGYDDNQPMVNRGLRVTGSQGSLPAWAGIAQALLDVEKIADRIDLVDLTFNGLALEYPDTGQFFLAVNPKAGGARVPNAAVIQQRTAPTRPASLVRGHLDQNKHFVEERHFLPYWRNQ